MGKLLLTDSIVKQLPIPDSGLTIFRDRKVRGFGVRILPSGTRAFVLDYTAAGRRRVYTIGKFGPKQWSTDDARKFASNLQRRIRHEGHDPAADLQERRDAPTVQELWDRFEGWQDNLSAEHEDKLRPSTLKGYRLMAEKDILPELGNRKLASITLADINALHQKITTKREAPYVANQVAALVRRLFNMAAKEWRDWSGIERNPCDGHGRNQETKRRRYLKKEELPRLMKALAEHKDQEAANMIRLLLLTGARRGEIESMRWDDLDFKEAQWIKPGSATKQKTTHEAPLSAPVLELLARLRKEAENRAKKSREPLSPFVFLGPGKSGHRISLEKDWEAICKAAKLTTTEKLKEGDGPERAITKKSIRIHDLRHSFASFAVSGGATLETIGELLGHTQVSTTKRYAHLFDDVKAAAAERVGAMIASHGKPSAPVLSLEGRRKGK